VIHSRFMNSFSGPIFQSVSSSHNRPPRHVLSEADSNPTDQSHLAQSFSAAQQWEDKAQLGRSRDVHPALPPPPRSQTRFPKPDVCRRSEEDVGRIANRPIAPSLGCYAPDSKASSDSFTKANDIGHCLERSGYVTSPA